MNSFIKAQIDNMIALTKNFEMACDLATIQDDGQTSRDEAKQLKKLHAATAKFRKELEALNK